MESLNYSSPRVSFHLPNPLPPQLHSKHQDSLLQTTPQNHILKNQERINHFSSTKFDKPHFSSQICLTSRSKPNKKYDFDNLTDLVPKWMLDRQDFKEFYVKSDLFEAMDLEKIINTPNETRDNLEKDVLLGWISKIEYFKSLPKNMTREICARLSCRSVKINETIISEGSLADFLYVIYKGTVGIYVNNVRVASNTEGDVVGDVAVHTNSTRKADVIAESDHVILFSISAVDYRSILFSYKTAEKQKICKFLSLISFFSNWPVKKIQDFSSTLVKTPFKKGDIIYEFSEESQVFYIIKSGKVEIQTFIDIESSNRWPIDCHEWNTRKVITKYEYPLKVLGTNSFFGQYEIIKKMHRETRAVALEDSICLALNKNDFKQFIKDSDLETLEHLNETYLPSKAEMDKVVRKNISYVKKNKEILMEAMKINCVPSDRDCLADVRAKKLRKWVKSVESRGNHEAKKVERRIVRRLLMESENNRKILGNSPLIDRSQESGLMTRVVSPVHFLFGKPKKEITVNDCESNKRIFLEPVSSYPKSKFIPKVALKLVSCQKFH